MKHLFLILIFLFLALSTLFGSQLQYFYTDKFYDKINLIKYIGTKQGIRVVKKRDGDFITTNRIPYKIYIYKIFCVKTYTIGCKNKINFNLDSNTNILKKFNCKITEVK